jgi:uncharacterized protein YhaN
VKLRRLAIQRLPGIAEGFVLDDIGDGVQVITGPNGIGKSSLCRATRALLWRERGPAGYMSAHALFEQEGQRLRVEREGSRHRWQRDGVDTDPPPLPAEHLDGCFFLTLHDLLDPSEHAGADLAHRIRLQMSGGFDIDGAANSLFDQVGPRHGRNEQKSLNKAEQNLGQAVAQQRDLSREEARLDELECELEEADTAARRRAYLDHALDAVKLREAHERVQVELSALPTACENLTGSELTDLQQREKELETKRRQKHDTQSDLQATLEDAASTRLEEPLDPALLATWRQRADALSTLETQIDSATEGLAGQRATLSKARRAVGGGEDGTGAIDLAGAAELFKFLRDSTRAQIESEGVAERLRILQGVVFTEEDRRRLALLRDAAGSLRAWLRAPDPALAANDAGRGRSKALYWAAALLIAAGVVLSFLVDLTFAAVAAAGLGIAIATWWLRYKTATASGQEAAQRDFPAGLDLPASWSASDVATRLREIEGDAAELEGLAKHAGFAEADRAKLENRRTDLQSRFRGIQERREALASQLGLEEIPADAELVDMARALDQLRAAAQAEHQGAERLRELTERYQARLSALSAEITRHGEAAPGDAAAARAAHESIAERNTRLRQARDRATAARSETARLDEDLTQIVKVISDIYRQRDLEPGDRAGLARLLDGLDRYRALCTERDRHATEIQFATGKLDAAGELDLADHDAVWLDAEKKRLDERASRREDIQSRISDIHAEVKRARGQHDVEETIANRDECRSQLDECRGEALRAAAGRLLLDLVKQEHEANQMPRVLERARELFARFTHHAYDLRVTPDAAGSFVAIEAHSGEGFRPDQLSDGTRVQLLLAARLAFANQAEGNTHLPLFLDEALDQSDPVRFRAIARSLGRIAADEDRQIFYLTSDPSDATRIQHALAEEGCRPADVIDLAAVRKQTAGAPDPESLHIEAPPEVPDPAEMTPEAYGAALGVAPLDPWRGHSAQHLFHLAWDDLALLHGLLASRIETVGQWELLSKNSAPLAVRIRTDSGIGAQLDDRAQLLDAFCRAWHEGRGKPVTREIIEESGAISDRYLDHIADIAQELDGDAERLIEIVSTRGDDRLQGFRTKAAEALQAYLTEHTYLDPRPVLAESDLTTRVLMAPAAGRLPERVVAACIHRWWRLSGQPERKE